jgi:hypothetical protein
LNDALHQRIGAYLETLPPGIAHQRGHDATYYVACRLVWGFALSPEDAWEFMLAFNARCEPPWSESELRHKLNDALVDPKHQHARGHLLDDGPGGKHVPLPPPPPKPVYEPETLARVASRVHIDVTPEWLEARSKFSCWNRSPAGVLHKLFLLGEKVVVFNIFESQGCEVWEHRGHGQDLSTLNYLARGQSEGVWFMAQPVDGEFHWNSRQEKESRRSEESVTAWRYLVIESDKAPKDLWLRALVQMPLAISAIYDSGGESIHVLVRIDAESKAQWDEGRDAIKPHLVKLGADPGTMTAVRLTRLPNCKRESKKRLQRLLYLNDDPDCGPLIQKPYVYTGQT